MKRPRKPIFIFLILTIIAFALTIWANLTIVYESENFVTNDIDELQAKKVGLLLGTSKLLNNGHSNDFFYFRIDAAVDLYNTGKIQYLIISGDNSREDYNEPLDMKQELTRRGIPEERIYLDYAGFRTLDSVVRARDIFGQQTFIVISQKFHTERAVFIARKNGMAAFGFNAREVDAVKGFKTKLRELLARDKVFWDLFFGVTPKLSGEKVTIE